MIFIFQNANLKCARGTVGRPAGVLLDQIAGATLRQPRGQRPRLRRHLLPAAVLRGGGGVCGGENVSVIIKKV